MPFSLSFICAQIGERVAQQSASGGAGSSSSAQVQLGPSESAEHAIRAVYRSNVLAAALAAARTFGRLPLRHTGPLLQVRKALCSAADPCT